MSGTWPWVALKQGNIGLVCERLLKEMVGDMGFGSVSLHRKGVCPDELFAVSKTWVALGGGDAPVSSAINARAPRT